VIEEDQTARFERQASQYGFPYHWLPSNDGSGPAIGRTLAWGLEYLAVLDTTADLVMASSPQRVLDLGCGDGRLAVELARRGVDAVVGVDLVEQAIAFARAFGAPLATRVRFECTPIEALEEGDFDVAVAMEVLEHIPVQALGAVLDATWQRVRAGGRFVVSVPTTNVPLIAKHERHYTESLLREHVLPHFEVESVVFVHRASRFNRLLRRIYTNRLVTLEEPHLRRAASKLYERYGRGAAPDDGAHMLATCRRI
jgi:2-polyprenyl-3-methyl-5-hydroxy-6-metoxy-1,4-benzoquinol methylase